MAYGFSYQISVTATILVERSSPLHIPWVSCDEGHKLCRGTVFKEKEYFKQTFPITSDQLGILGQNQR